MDYSEWVDPGTTQIATDNAGALYLLSPCSSLATSTSCVSKLSPDGKTLLWRNSLGFTASQMAVDANGSAYVVPTMQQGQALSVFVEKLTSDGTSVAWQMPIGFGVSPTAVDRWVALTVDSSGRAYVGGYDDTKSEGYVVRLNAAGTGIDYTTVLMGMPGLISADTSGSAFVEANALQLFGSPNDQQYPFVARLSSDGSIQHYSVFFPDIDTPPGVYGFAVDANGDAVVYLDYFDHAVLQRMDAADTLAFSKNIPSMTAPARGLALDSAGNAYITGYSASQIHAVRNSLAPCGSYWLNVYAPDGSVLQSTYLPSAPSLAGNTLVATGPNSTVFVVAPADATFMPTQAGLYPASGASGGSLLMRLSPNGAATIFPLACVGNAASYDTGPIAPGTILTLFGNGLGPQDGVQAQASIWFPFQKRLSGVDVTFDGEPAPLLWVQDSQINVATPWSLIPGQATEVCVSYNSVSPITT